MGVLAPLPPAFATTREALHALACYVIAPARKARTGRIGLRATGDGFGTPAFDDGGRLLVRGTVLVREPDAELRLTTVRAAAEFLGVTLSPDPGVGHDLPPYAPDVPLDIDEASSLALGAWYRFGNGALERLRDELRPGAASEAQLWPEHFDLAVVVEPAPGATANVGFSPGDGFLEEPYAYVGPQEWVGPRDAYWNAPFGAFLPYRRLAAADDPTGLALAFVGEGLALLADAAPPRRERTADAT